jgi:ABC-type amino acid transport system permease subunit
MTTLPDIPRLYTALAEVLAALMYFCITYPAGKAIEALERRMRRGDKH